MQRQEESSPVLEITKQEEEKSNIFQLMRIKLNIKVKAWTDRMLAALDNGVQGFKWFSLIDKVNNQDTLYTGWEMVKRNRGAAGVDKVTIERVEARPDLYISEIERDIREGKYKPLAIRRVYILKEDGKSKRPLGIPVIKDRIVQAAIKLVIEPIFEQEFAETSYGFRPGRGCKDALRKVQENLNEGYTWILDADLKSYFDTIPHENLMERIKEKIADGRVLSLIEQFIKANIMEECKEWTPESGVPQGAVLSPLFSNIYLHPLDKIMEENGIKMVRYADDFVIMCKSEDKTNAALGIVQEWVHENGLTLHPEKTHIVDCSQPGKGFEFLGYRFENGKRYVKKKNLDKIKDKIRTVTRRNSGDSLQTIILKLNRSLRGWFEYFKHAHHWIFSTLDGFIRRRLRAMLKRRKKKTGMGKTFKDHNEWPNKFFAEAGLFSLKAAQEYVAKTIKTAKAC